ncbi:hypothetical protein [Nonomuraea recticatena]|uniref:hypothetical protein n=1 Tax=Nonomuraea recticatena TaxID=46178 RepID=UPI00360A61A8
MAAGDVATWRTCTPLRRAAHSARCQGVCLTALRRRSHAVTATAPPPAVATAAVATAPRRTAGMALSFVAISRALVVTSVAMVRTWASAWCA